ncbi:RICIN domain-containing protein [Kitasatospora sp. NPDC059747]|uniref:RICIN domain-containing protein n=1 Tax=Kitasatospora sp. NPDC059747 TaxID=3346930 RepID=UPI00364FE4BC
MPPATSGAGYAGWRGAGASPARADEASSGSGSTIMNVGSHMCIGAKGGGSEPGRLVQQWDCSKKPEQSWTFKEAGQGYTIENGHGLCLGIQEGSKNKGAPAVQAKCDGSSDRHWKLNFVHGSSWQLVNSNSGYCLGIREGSKKEGADALQWDCLDIPDQQWKLQVG